MTPKDLPLAGLRLSLAGPGKVGRSLTAWAVAQGARLEWVGGRDTAGSAAEVARRLGGRPVAAAELATAGEDLLVMAVSDPALPDLARCLAPRRQAAVVLHTSGSLGASVLHPLREGGSAVGSLHPLKAFPQPLEDPAAAQGTLFAVDGDPAAQGLARRLVASWGGETVEIPEGQRAVYHLGATLAAGGVLTLLAVAEGLARAAGLPPAVRRGYLALAEGALAQARRMEETAPAITGPVARGDQETTTRQLAALEKIAPGVVRLVVELGVATLREMGRTAPLTPRHQALLDELTRKS